jgi:site-specific recombinase XerD
VAQSRPTDPDRIGRDDVAAFIAHLRVKGRKPGTIATRYDGLKRFFRWLEDAEDIGASPMAKMHRPMVPMTDVPLDTGLRIGGLVSMTVEGTDLQKGRAAYRKKGGNLGEVPLGSHAAKALDRYLRARSRHRLANRPDLWLGLEGPVTTSGVRQVLARHAEAIGAEDLHLHPHMFRHTFVDWWLRNHRAGDQPDRDHGLDQCQAAGPVRPSHPAGSGSPVLPAAKPRGRRADRS